jgi:hypothetical protein
MQSSQQRKSVAIAVMMVVIEIVVVRCIRVEMELNGSVGTEVVLHQSSEHLQDTSGARAIVVNTRSAPQSTEIDRVLVRAKNHNVVRCQALDARNDRRLRPWVLKEVDRHIGTVAGIGLERVVDPVGCFDAALRCVESRVVRRENLDIRLEIRHFELGNQ